MFSRSGFDDVSGADVHDVDLVEPPGCGVRVAWEFGVLVVCDPSDEGCGEWQEVPCDRDVVADRSDESPCGCSFGGGVSAFDDALEEVEEFVCELVVGHLVFFSLFRFRPLCAPEIFRAVTQPPSP